LKSEIFQKAFAERMQQDPLSTKVFQALALFKPSPQKPKHIEKFSEKAKTQTKL